MFDAAHLGAPICLRFASRRLDHAIVAAYELARGGAPDEPRPRRLARTADVVDAALIVLSQDGDSVLTSDVRDLERLAAAAGVHIDLVPV